MRLPNLLLGAAALAALATGCGDTKCATDVPQVDAMASGCTAVVNQPVNYPLRLCPACNLSIVSCDVQISGDQIFLNPTAEACESASSCSTSCALQPTSCTFTPTAAGQYTVTVYDPASGPKTQTLNVVSSDSPSCALTG